MKILLQYIVVFIIGFILPMACVLVAMFAASIFGLSPDYNPHSWMTPAQYLITAVSLLAGVMAVISHSNNRSRREVLR
jgi:hypothetical protein